ncbi:RNA polymerase beta subunit, putative (apicoplast) [Plasmodium ovale]|uniref:DNA-directed RNA polymerase subunit n=2 Tax=Plasmodium ovale TaxID=36330 RepID=A0A2D0NLV1_PLAOA|nr:DNA-directed RNA polymerase subunit C [Plasmodium ovale wallikeri]SBT79081.1 RNA polymerase beta subunit, putative [Plasmodium ovale]
MIIYNNINFVGLKLNILNPKQIIKWSSIFYKNKINIGEVLIPHTINFNTGNPILNGLFCEKIFDYMYIWNCNCNKKLYNVNNFSFFLYCKFCKNKLKININRKYKLGFIFLNIPILHLWYLTGPLQVASLLLNKNVIYLKFLIYYKYFFNNIKYKQYFYYNKLYFKLNINRKNIYNNNVIQYLFSHNILYKKLKNLNLLTELLSSKEYLLLKNKYSKKYIYKKINLLNLFIINNIKPNWIFLDLLPILPAGLRPYFYINNSMYIISTINENYRLIILKNNKLKYWLYLRNNIFFIFEIIEKRLLQQLIDYLLINKLILKNNNTFFNFSKIFQGKYSIIKYNLLGKRVDFSGRSVITVNPNIIYNNIGIPYFISLNLFKPFLLKILKCNIKFNIIFKSLLINKSFFSIQKFLNKLLQNQFIIVNRAPTLHRMNLQSFRPLLTEGYSLKFYPLGCLSFNADFDGDQMSIFLPLMKTSKFESNLNLNFDKNIISPSNNKNLFKNLQYYKLGINTLLILNYNKINNVYFFNSIEKIYELYNNNSLYIFNLVWIKYINNNKIFYLLTSINRIIINLYMYIY